ncbi:MAG: circularly permuted type 2 ATP-grasp protein, partial [Planctomycetota bacterium]
MEAQDPPAATAPRQRYGLSFWLLLICAMALGASLLVNLVMLAVVAMATSGDLDQEGQPATEELLPGSGDRMILQIDIEGVITTIGEDGLFGPLPSLTQRVQEWSFLSTWYSARRQPLDPRGMDQQQLQQLLQQLHDSGETLTAVPHLDCSQAPVWQDERVQQRAISLRAFVIREGTQLHVLPGGLV